MFLEKAKYNKFFVWYFKLGFFYTEGFFVWYFKLGFFYTEGAKAFIFSNS